ncbi:MAG: sulfur carrier protein [Bacteroidota bacterium]|nr:sulfur carrier protein [Bacteroidota bacterium]MDQ1332598.1 sulfur carrier protein [Bacteroidota bacterium]
MKILLNNREETFDRETLTVREMLELKKYSFRMRIIKINGVLISGEDYDSVIIHDGDVVHMLYLMSGG